MTGKEEHIDASDGDQDYEMVSDITDGSADNYDVKYKRTDAPSLLQQQ